jgi:hypothetical protein
MGWIDGQGAQPVRARTSALTFVGALVAAAFTSGSGIGPIAMLRVGSSSHAVVRSAAQFGARGPMHPVISRIAPPALLSTAARHVPQAAPAPHCTEEQERGRSAAYNGRSVSALYDGLFTPGTQMPYLASYIPQSMADWPNWDGAGHDLVLLGMYSTGRGSYLVGLDPDSDRVVGTLSVDPSHLGGMAFLGSWLFTGDNPWPLPGSPSVQRYRIDDLRAAMHTAVATGDKPYVAGDGPRQPIHATDFMTVDGDSMYTGNHGNPIPGVMYRYVLDGDGHLAEAGGPWSVPARAQGLIITPDDFLFSTDNDTGRGELVAVRRDDPDRPIACIWMPSMPEDMTVHHGQVLSSFESGAARYADDDPSNRITHLHCGSLAALLRTVDPVALDAERAVGIAPPGVELWTPTQRVSDAYDYYLSHRKPSRVSDSGQLYASGPARN